MMAAYRCPVCDYVYDEANGDAREGFPAGTGWDQIPDDWCCLTARCARRSISKR